MVVVQRKFNEITFKDNHFSTYKYEGIFRFYDYISKLKA